MTEKLSKKQRLVARELFEARLTEPQILEHYGLSRRQLSQWLNKPEFQEELQRLCQATMRQTRFIIARYGPVAALKLVDLLGSDKPDVSRRAALDVIDRCFESAVSPDADQEQAVGTGPFAHLTDQQVEQMLVTLARGFERSLSGLAQQDGATPSPRDWGSDLPQIKE